MTMYLVTDEANPEWNALVNMTEAEAGLVEDADFGVDPLNPADAVSFAEFSAEHLDES